MPTKHKPETTQRPKTPTGSMGRAPEKGIPPHQAQPSPSAIAPDQQPAGAEIRRGRPSGSRSGRSGPSRYRIWGLLGSLAVGTAVGAIGPWEYKGQSVFEIQSSAGNRDAIAPYRTHLINHAWRHAPPGSADRPNRWDVIANPATGRITLELRTTGKAKAIEALQEVSRGFLDQIQDVAYRSLTQPGEGEQVLAERLEDLRSGMSKVAHRLDEARSSLPGGDVIAARANATRQLESERADLQKQRGLLRDAKTRLAQIKASVLPDAPPIERDNREQALRADVVLQQDMKELNVRLVLVRSQLSGVWQGAAPALDDLVSAAAELERSLDGQDIKESGASTRVALERVLNALDDYQSSLREFTKSWTREFITLRQSGNDDPLSSTILETHERIRSLLADFLFGASGSLTLIREQVRVLGQDSDSQAKHHVLTTALLRGFGKLQTAHHQFEFAASGVQSSDNFRLTSAIRSAKGLRRRSLIRQTEIEHQLLSAAREDARRVRRQEIADLTGRIEAWSQDLDEALQRMLNRQGQADAANRLAESYTKAAATVDATDDWIGDLRGQIVRTEAGLSRMAEQRRTPVRPDDIKMVSCSMEAVPLNLANRLIAGWGAFAGAMLLLLLMQGLLSSRRAI